MSARQAERSEAKKKANGEAMRVAVERSETKGSEAQKENAP
ncbi:MAG: hypothetical protein ACK40V_05775 [Anaerolineales bacterium]